MRLFAAILREIPQNLKRLTLMNILSAVATAMVLWLVDAAGKDAAAGDISPRLVLMYATTVTLFGVSHDYILVTASADAETLIHKLRLRLFNAVRQADLMTVEHIGRAALHAALIQDTQVLGRTLPLLAIGAQQAVILVFLAIYMAWLSPIACIMAFGFAGLAVAVRYARTRTFRQLMGESSKAEASVFDGLTDLLRGFKEVRMNRPRADGLLRDLAQSSATARRANVETTTQKGQNFAVIEAMFYTLIGLMVFVVPLFGTDYYTVVVPATTAALFIVGPVSTVSFVSPMITQADMALSNIEAMEDRLSDASHGAPADGQGRSAGPVPEKPTTIALRNAVFTHCDAKGKELFTVGPLSAEFRAGEITFVTGGNGSGKSTMLKLLIGLIPLKEGTLLVDGQPVMAEQMQDYRDRISAIFSDYHLSRRLYDMHAADPASILEHLKEMEMQSKVTVSDGAFSTVDLSTGQRKRLALVVAMLEDKQVIVLDEWAADQDPEFREVFYTKLLPKLKEQNKIVICVSHDDTWFKSKKPQINMKDGRIVHALPD